MKTVLPTAKCILVAMIALLQMVLRIAMKDLMMPKPIKPILKNARLPQMETLAAKPASIIIVHIQTLLLIVNIRMVVQNKIFKYGIC